MASINVPFGGNSADAWYQRKVLRELGRLKMTLIISRVAYLLSGSRLSLYSPVSWHQSDLRIGGLDVVMAVLLSS
jgi:hypothetical protein